LSPNPCRFAESVWIEIGVIAALAQDPGHSPGCRSGLASEAPGGGGIFELALGKEVLLIELVLGNDGAKARSKKLEGEMEND
jgi:hypothetical protein